METSDCSSSLSTITHQIDTFEGDLIGMAFVVKRAKSMDILDQWLSDDWPCRPIALAYRSHALLPASFVSS
jgi:hypothetical protein